jgi:hypothetical protein
MKKFNLQLGYILLAAMLISFAGCSDSDDDSGTLNPLDPPLIIQNVYSFLQLGNTWTYDTYENDDLVSTNDLQLNFVHYYDLDPEEYGNLFAFQDTSLYQGNILFYYVFNDKDSSLYTTRMDGVTIVRYPTLHLNQYVGQTWEAKYTDGAKRLKEVTDLNATITVPAGTFSNCIVVNETRLDPNGNITAVETEYFRNDIGVIYWLAESEATATTPASKHEIKLKSKNF